MLLDSSAESGGIVPRRHPSGCRSTAGWVAAALLTGGWVDGTPVSAQTPQRLDPPAVARRPIGPEPFAPVERPAPTPPVEAMRTAFLQEGPAPSGQPPQPPPPAEFPAARNGNDAPPPAASGRLEALGAPRFFGATPRPTPEVRTQEQRFVERLVDPESLLDLVLHRHRLMVLKQVPRRIQIADDEVAAYGLVTERELSIVGKKTGTTVLNLWFDDPANPGGQTILSFLVRVLPDPEAKERLERVYKALEAEINRTFPNSVVRLSLAGDKIVVEGDARDVEEGVQILRVVRANAPQERPENIPVGNVNVYAGPEAVASAGGDGPESDGDGFAPPTLQNFLVAGGPSVINRLRIPGEHQVSLKVTVAEVNRSALRSIGSNLSVGGADASFFSLFPGLGTVGGNVLINDGDFSLALNALRRLNLARSLAEPNLVTLNGRPANFLAGGSFPVPQITGFTGAGLQGVQFIPFGVQLTFTPYVSDRNRIRLNVQAQVSTRDDSVLQTNIGGSSVPSLTERTFRTQVELRHGQSLAVAGLLQNNFGASSERVPLFGDVPILGRLFSNDVTSYDEQELVIVVTPELVHPLDACLPLPGSDVFEPSDCEFYLLGRLESGQGYDYRSTVNTWWNAAPRGAGRSFRQAQQRCIVGPSGHSDGKR